MEQLIEAALFLAGRSLTIEQLSKITRASPEQVEKSLHTLQGYWKDRGLELFHSNDGWQLRVRPDLLPKISKLRTQTELSEGCRRTLALIVMKEPVNQSILVKIQGNKIYDYIHQLEDKGLVKGVRSGRTKKLSLTPLFESYFGVDRAHAKEMLASK